ncbi:MAG: hypothetical protein ACKO7W_00400, partial [Elainella sp.]
QPPAQPVQPTVPTLPAVDSPQSVNYWRAAQHDQQFINQAIGYCSQPAVSWQSVECQALAQSLH